MKIAIIDSGVGLVELLRLLKLYDIRHEYHLLFSSFFPVGSASEADLEAEGARLEAEVESGGYDLCVVCCNTLSFYLPSREKYLKVLDINRAYLDEHPSALLIATERTVKNLGRGFADQPLVTAIENQAAGAIDASIRSWPPAPEYLLGCTHFALALSRARQLRDPATVTDLTQVLCERIAALPPGSKLTCDFGRKEAVIRRFLRF